MLFLFCWLYYKSCISKYVTLSGKFLLTKKNKKEKNKFRKEKDTNQKQIKTQTQKLAGLR